MYVCYQGQFSHNFCRALRILSRSCWHGEYKPGSRPEPLAVKAPLFTWSVQCLLLQCAAALQRCMEQTLWSRLRCWVQWHKYFTHFKLFYFPNIIELFQRIIRFVICTKLKASYRTVQYEYAYRYTPNIYIYIYIYKLCRSCIIMFSGGSAR